MIINWYKYIRDLLPPALRLKELVELIKVLVWQVSKGNYYFDLFLAKANYKVNVNASVIALEKLIYTELDAIASIEELDGKPFDFLVNVHSIVDEKRLKALIDTYKLEGKSYTFKLGAVAYEVDYINHVCEDIIELYEVEYINHECEQDGVIQLTGSAYIDGATVIARVIASQPVASELTINTRLKFKNTNGDTVYANYTNVVIDVGSTMGIADTSTDQSVGYDFSIVLVSVAPNSDDYYSYMI